MASPHARALRVSHVALQNTPPACHQTWALAGMWNAATAGQVFLVSLDGCQLLDNKHRAHIQSLRSMFGLASALLNVLG